MNIGARQPLKRLAEIITPPVHPQIVEKQSESVANTFAHVSDSLTASVLLFSAHLTRFLCFVVFNRHVWFTDCFVYFRKTWGLKIFKCWIISKGKKTCFLGIGIFFFFCLVCGLWSTTKTTTVQQQYNLDYFSDNCHFYSTSTTSNLIHNRVE